MSPDISFIAYKKDKLPVPFNNSESSSYVFHTLDNEIVNDNKTHIYIQAVKGYSKRIVRFILSDKSLEYPKEVYVLVKDSESFAELKFFLEENFYGESDEITRKKFVNNKYEKFVKDSLHLVGANFNNYIAALFNSAGIESTAINYVNKYIQFFQVALTSSDVKTSSLENYELLESLGDHASWKVMTEIFLKYMVDKKLEMKESIITSLHRSFVSKVVQAKICREINLHTFIVSQNSPTVSVCEDVFEAFCGALYYVDFLICAYVGKQFFLLEKFLRWAFSSVDFSTFEEKPEITQFHEYMKILIGPYNFTEKKHGGMSYMTFDESVQQKLKDALPHVSEETIQNFLRSVKEPYSIDSEKAIELRKNKYSRINNYILENFGDEVFFTERKNNIFMKDWEREIVEKFIEVTAKFDRRDVILDRRFYDKSKTNFCWVLQNREKKDVYSTMNFSDSENPNTLVLIIEENKGVDVLDVREVKKVEYIRGDYYEENGKKYNLVGDKNNIEEFLKTALLNRENGFYISVSNEIQEEIFVRYSPYYNIEFEKGFDIDYVRRKLPVKEANEYPKQIYKYIGDRMSYGQVSLIAMKKFNVRDDHNMSIMKNFFRSKNLKDEFTRLIDLRDSEGKLIHYDELLGMNYKNAELVIEYMYSMMILPKDILKTPSDILTKIAKPICKKKGINYENISIVGNSYVYQDTVGKKFSVEINGHNYLQVKNCLARYLISREKEINPKWNKIQNEYFSIFTGYTDLEEFFQSKKIHEWDITSDKNEKKLFVSFEHNGTVHTYKSISLIGFSSIIKQIKNDFYI